MKAPPFSFGTASVISGIIFSCPRINITIAAGRVKFPGPRIDHPFAVRRVEFTGLRIQGAPAFRSNRIRCWSRLHRRRFGHWRGRNLLKGPRRAQLKGLTAPGSARTGGRSLARRCKQKEQDHHEPVIFSLPHRSSPVTRSYAITLPQFIL